ncbi:nucleotidyltransferase domain-containing protein [Spirosoma taeanense]|uniref:Nucleotidyltransferase domain-containing protein n=1 Tax=Spirosoma taeanense TaxID=2735870 RepID=A0A6M5Y663_9BACT|nr:nucleotidyltransferase domain-containing protein [Spirosoma taeanense]QJW89379.1 nucleotidyltransferase domain-containing protein [Spirosoma taeanense]
MSAILQPYQQFINQAVEVIQRDPEALGLAAGGSWASGEVDSYSDLDLVLVTTQPIAPDLEPMRAYAARLGTMVASFRGDHVGEPRLLIALYEPPLLHVDIKFLTLPEFHQRIEEPVILWERGQALTTIQQQTQAVYPEFDYQWAEDRFWIWMHYALLKIGRGEFFEALDFLAFVRNVILGPMLHLRNGGLPRGVRRVETALLPDDLARLRRTVATPQRKPLIDSILEVMHLYEDLRDQLAPATLHRNDSAKRLVESYFKAIIAAETVQS